MRSTLILFGTALVFSAIAACGGSDSNPPPPPSDGGADASPVNQGPDGGPGPSQDAGTDATSPNGEDSGPGNDADAGTDATSPNGEDSGPGNDADAGDPDATGADADAGEAGLPARAGLRLATGAQVVGVTADNYVVYWVTAPVPAQGTPGVLAAVSAGGGNPQILTSSATGAAVVAGSTAAWEEPPSGAGACAGGVSIHTWSSAHGAQQVAPLAVEGLQVTGGQRQTFPPAAMNADGSEVTYFEACYGVPIGFLDDGGVMPTVPLAVTATNGSTSLVTQLTPPPPEATLFLAGTTVMMQPTDGPANPILPNQVFAGDPLTQRLSGAGLIDPNGVWAWVPVTGGMGLVKAADGTVVFTDPSAASEYNAYYYAAAFDATGANLFYTTAARGDLKQITLASPTTAVTLTGSGAACGAILAAAPNGATLLCSAGADGGIEYSVVTAGASSKTFSLPDVDSKVFPSFLSDSTLTWSNGAALLAETVAGGPVSTVAPWIQSVQEVGGSQVFGFDQTFSTAFVADASGKVPTFALSPLPGSRTVFAPPGGGLVAYSAGGAIYAVQTL